MKRPFAVIGFSCFVALLILSLTDSVTVAYCMLFTATAAGLISLLIKKSRQALTLPVCFFTVAAACLLFMGFNSQKQHVQALTGDSVAVEATVAEAPYIKKENGRHYCVLELNTVDGKRASGRMRLSFSPRYDGIDPSLLEIGNSIGFTAKVYIPGKDDRDISRYFSGESILLGAYGTEDITITEAKIRGPGFYFNRLREFVSERLRYGFGDKTAGILIGMLTGDKSVLDSSAYEALRKSGTAHLLAVSGLHLSLWIFALSSLIPERKRYTKLRTVLLMAAVVFIMLLSGMSESVKRAGFMSLVFLSGRLIDRYCDSLNSLGFAVTVMLVYNPAAVLSISLQLSVLSTLGILTLGKRCMEKSAQIFDGRSIPLKRLLRYITDMLFISLSVLVFTLPVMLYSFGGFSTVSAFVNMLVSPIVSPLLILAGLCVIFSGLPFVFYPLALIVRLLTDYVVKTAELFSSFKNSYLLFEADNLILLLASAIAVTALFTLFLSKPFRGKAALAFTSVILTAVLLLTARFTDKDASKLHLAFYGDTVAAAVQCNNAALLLYGTENYEKELFISELSEKGISDFYELTENKDGAFMKLDDGKLIYNGDIFEKLCPEQTDNTVRLQLKEKYINIFYGDALQYNDSCDIIIKLTENDIILTADGRDFLLSDEGRLTLTVTDKNEIILRGEGTWLNLMKSN